MDRCDYCGEGCDLTHQCSYCDRDHCSDHRLPERHDCIGQHAMGSDAPLGTGGPETDRRSTYTQRIDRVRETETENWETKVDDDPTDADDDQDEVRHPFLCGTCDERTHHLLECPYCGDTHCRDCHHPRHHDCGDGEQLQLDRDQVVGTAPENVGDASPDVAPDGSIVREGEASEDDGDGEEKSWWPLIAAVVLVLLAFTMGALLATGVLGG